MNNTKKEKAKPVVKKLTVYRNYFISDTRTILALLKISQIEYVFEAVDIFEGGHQKASYLEMNPCGTIPMIID